jgi:hypothetical protein
MFARLFDASSEKREKHKRCERLTMKHRHLASKLLLHEHCDEYVEKKDTHTEVFRTRYTQTQNTVLVPLPWNCVYTLVCIDAQAGLLACMHARLILMPVVVRLLGGAHIMQFPNMVAKATCLLVISSYDNLIPVPEIDRVSRLFCSCHRSAPCSKGRASCIPQ